MNRWMFLVSRIMFIAVQYEIDSATLNLSQSDTYMYLFDVIRMIRKSEMNVVTRNTLHIHIARN